MHRRNSGARWALLVSLLALAGCASGPGIFRRPVPDWVLYPPAATEQHEYFVAVGGDPGGDREAAENRAAKSLLIQINQALGVDVSVLTTAEARSTLESYEASVVEQVTQSGSGRVEGLRIADRYVVDDEGRVTVSLLGEYERGAFLAERAERRALLAAREELLLGPERAADADAATGRAGTALSAYVQAAAAAARAGSELRIAPAVLERSLRKALSLADGLVIRALSGPTRVMTGVVPGEPIRFVVADSSGRPAAGVPVELSYTEPVGRSTAVRRVSLISSADGTVGYEFPRVERVGRIEVTARVDSASLRASLSAVPDSYRTQRNALENALATPRASWSFDAFSRAASIPTTLVVVETDARGAAMPSGRTNDGIAHALLEAGFRIVTNDVDPTAQLGLDRSQLIQSLQYSLPAEARRAVYGSATIADFAEGNGFLVKVSATIIVVDLGTGEIVYSMSGVKNAQSSSAEQAMNTAFLQLGRTIGEELAARLP